MSQITMMFWRKGLTAQLQGSHLPPGLHPMTTIGAPKTSRPSIIPGGADDKNMQKHEEVAFRTDKVSLTGIGVRPWIFPFYLRPV